MTKKLIFFTLIAAFVLVFSSTAFAGDEFVKGFNKNLELYPEWIGLDAQGLPSTMPIFNYNTAGSFISEIVWVEVPCDTDRDGRRDRISLYIRRPVTKEGFLCPVVMEFSPYHNGTIAYTRMSNYISNPDDHLRALAETFRYHDNYPLTIPINPDTTSSTYDDIKYKGTEPWDPIWWKDKGAFTVNSWYTGVSPGQVPAATVPTATGAASSYTWSPPARHQHYFTRGYALVYGQLLGNRDCFGIPNCMHIEECIAAAAAVKWFAGEATAFTTRDGSVEVKADWANGHVAMDGTSYPGTTPMAAAITGVEGLKAIMPEANLISWYEGYRCGGGLHSPDGFGGEDMNIHASYNFSRINADVSGNNVIPPPVGPYFNFEAQKAYVSTQQHMMKVQDRDSGDYNTEWDARNLARGYGHIRSDLGILHTNAQQDWNLLPRHGYEMVLAFNDMFDGAHKLVSGLSTHASQSGRLVPGKDGVERGMLKWYLMFLDHFLLGLDNKVDELMYDVNIANNITGIMEGYDYDPAVEERGSIMPGARYNTIYLTTGPANKAGRLSYQAPAPTVEHFADLDIHAQLTAPLHVGVVEGGGASGYNRPANTVGTIASQGNRMISSAQAQWCEDRFIGVHRATTAYGAGNTLIDLIDKPIAGRLMYISEPLTERLQLSGTPVAHLQIAPDRGMGTLSVALVEIGRKGRVSSGRTGSSAGTTGSTVVFPAFGGVAVANATRYANPVGSTQGNFKYVTWGHTDVQNPSYDGKAWFEVPEQYYTPNFYFQTTKIVPNDYYPYVVELNPYNYTFDVGTRVAVMIFGTDPWFSPLLTPECTPEFNVRLGPDSYIDVPLRLAEPTEPITLEAGSSLVELGDTVDITYSVKGNDFGFTTLELELPFDSSIYAPLTVAPAAVLAGADFAFAIAGDILKITVAAADNIAGDGALFTVTYQVKETAPRIFNTPLGVKVIGAKFASLMDKMVDLEVIIKAGALKTYDFTAYLAPDKTKLTAGETVLVDVMFIGDKTFSQLASEITYDPSLLEYNGYINLYGWAAAVSKPADGKIAVRSVPSMNMVAGTPCSSSIKIVTLQFTATENLAQASVTTALGFASALASPAGGVTGTLTAPGKPAEITIIEEI
jgi:hypothetical protein